MLSKLAIGLLALASLFGLSKPANAQGYWGMYDSGYGWLYHPSDTLPFFNYPLYYPYLAYYAYLAYYSPYYPGSEEEAKAAEERRKVRAACSGIYQNTVEKKIKDLTVGEEQRVRACQALGLYPPR